MPNPFTNTGKIEDRRYFFGRKEQLDEIFDRLNGVQPGSVNLVGERRIGRSSLLWHIQTIASERLPPRFKVVYLDQQSSTITSPDTFRAAVLRGLDYPPTAPPVTATHFENALGDLRANGWVAVLLLDEFESLTERPAEFNANFYDGLRSLMNNHLLTCVLTTRKPLSEFATTNPALSTLHGLCLKVDVKNLKDDEVVALLRQPTEHAFGKTQIDLSRRWAGNHPLRLNLAANRIYQQLAKWNGAWSNEQARQAEQKYKEDEHGIFSGSLARPSKVGRIAAPVWSFWHRCANWFEAHPKTAIALGCVLLVVFALIVGRLTFPQLFDALLRQTGLLPTPTPTP